MSPKHFRPIDYLFELKRINKKNKTQNLWFNIGLLHFMWEYWSNFERIALSFLVIFISKELIIHCVNGFFPHFFFCFRWAMFILIFDNFFVFRYNWTTLKWKWENKKPNLIHYKYKIIVNFPGFSTLAT